MNSDDVELPDVVDQPDLSGYYRDIVAGNENGPAYLFEHMMSEGLALFGSDLSYYAASQAIKDSSGESIDQLNVYVDANGSDVVFYYTFSDDGQVRDSTDTYATLNDGWSDDGILDSSEYELV